jgi:hypothetical protein
MNKILERAIAEVARLPDEEQEAIACLMLEAIETERRWDELFARSGSTLSNLARQAKARHVNGQTTDSLYGFMKGSVVGLDHIDLTEPAVDEHFMIDDGNLR